MFFFGTFWFNQPTLKFLLAMYILIFLFFLLSCIRQYFYCDIFLLITHKLHVSCFNLFALFHYNADNRIETDSFIIMILPTMSQFLVLFNVFQNFTLLSSEVIFSQKVLNFAIIIELNEFYQQKQFLMFFLEKN